MLGLLFGGLSNIFSELIWWALGISAFVVFVCFVINKFFNGLALKIPGFSAINTIALLVTGVTGSIKIIAFVTYVMTAQQQIDKANDRANGWKAQAEAKQKEIDRKQAQLDAIEQGDKETITKYVPTYRVIEKLRTVPDLSVSNQLALDLTTKFYEMDEVPNATPPAK